MAGIIDALKSVQAVAARIDAVRIRSEVEYAKLPDYPCRNVMMMSMWYGGGVVVGLLMAAADYIGASGHDRRASANVSENRLSEA